MKLRRNLNTVNTRLKAKGDNKKRLAMLSRHLPRNLNKLTIKKINKTQEIGMNTLQL